MLPISLAIFSISLILDLVTPRPSSLFSFPPFLKGNDCYQIETENYFFVSCPSRGSSLKLKLAIKAGKR